MISHKFKCIFIHIPRTAGSSLETWLCDSDWGTIEKETKHLIASQAKELYREYWDEYYKFSFVRNPWDRVVSGLKFQHYFGVTYRRHRLMPFLRQLNFDAYEAHFGYETVLEHDHRYYKREALLSDRHLPGQVYGNILDEPLDFIGKFENLEKDCRIIKSVLGVEKEMKIHAQSSQRRKYQDYYNKNSRELVEKIYSNDIEKYDYAY